jgi:hypothetical protein
MERKAAKEVILYIYIYIYSLYGSFKYRTIGLKIFFSYAFYMSEIALKVAVKIASCSHRGNMAFTSPSR